MRWNMLGALAPLAMMAASAGAATPAPVARTVAETAARSPENVKLDAVRKPAEVLRFLGLERGMRVLDLFGANRYWAEIIAPAVRPGGRVIVWQPTQFYGDKGRSAFAEFAGRQPNAGIMSSPMQAPALAPDSYDFALMNLDYHDLYWQDSERGIVRMDPDRWLGVLFAAMRPGAVVGVIDHVAAPGGDTRAVVDKLHRIDPAVLRADFERAGFVTEATSDMLANPADDHSLNVFDEKIRGRTDRALFKFRKPAR